MDFEGEFTVPGQADDVIRRFTDIERMARCVPGASLEGQEEDGGYIGVMTVAFGPKKIKLRGRVYCEFDLKNHSGLIRGRAAADMRAARVEVRTTFTVRDDASSETPASIVSLKSEADLQGVLAEFARTGGTAVANVIMEEFARRLAVEFSSDGSSDVAGSEAAAVSGFKIMKEAGKKWIQSRLPGRS